MKYHPCENFISVNAGHVTGACMQRSNDNFPSYGIHIIAKIVTLYVHFRSEVDPDDPRFETDGRRLFEGMLHALQDVSV